MNAAVTPAAAFEAAATPDTPTITPNATVANSIVTAAPTAVVSTPAGNSPIQTLAAAIGNSLAISSSATATTTATNSTLAEKFAGIPRRLWPAADCKPPRRALRNRSSEAPRTTSSATPFGGRIATDADGDSEPANATPNVDLSAQSAGQQSAAASDQPTLSDTNESTDDWLAALDGLDGGTLLGDTSGLPTPSVSMRFSQSNGANRMPGSYFEAVPVLVLQVCRLRKAVDSGEFSYGIRPHGS